MLSVIEKITLDIEQKRMVTLKVTRGAEGLRRLDDKLPERHVIQKLEGPTLLLQLDRAGEEEAVLHLKADFGCYFSKVLAGIEVLKRLLEAVVFGFVIALYLIFTLRAKFGNT